MRTRAFAMIGVLAVALLACPGLAYGDKVMVSVPDWNQPNTYAPPNNGDYPNWCSPTAGADLMGYWEDHYGRVGLTDRQAFPASPAYANNLGTYRQGLWHDGTVELGWWMDTGGWRTAAGPFPPKAGNTILNLIGPGLVQYAADTYKDPGSGIQKVAYNAVPGIDTQFKLQMWTNYMAEIDADRPALVSFSSWVDTTKPLGSQKVDSQDVYMYVWGPQISEGHTTCGVGYYDPTPAAIFSGDEQVIVQDNWSITPQYVMVPLDNHWWQNDYITSVTVIPEPATLALAVLGLGALLVRRKRR